MEHSFRGLWNTSQHTIIYKMRLSKEEERERSKKNTSRNKLGQNLLKHSVYLRFCISKSSKDSKENRFKEIHTQTQYIQLPKVKNKDWILKAAKRSDFSYTSESSVKLKVVSQWKLQRPEGCRMAKKKWVNQEFYIYQSCPSKMKEKLRHSKINKKREFVASIADLP